MRLLVTRPLPDARRTASHLEAMGHEVTVMPLLRMEALPPRRLPVPAAIVVTSRNGVRAMANWPDVSSWFGLRLFAVGSATAEEARRAGFTDVRVAGGDGAALAALVAGSMEPDAGPVLYAAAEERTPDLESRLRQAGLQLEIVLAYRMVAERELDQTVALRVAEGVFDGVLLYSRRSAEIFLDLVERASLKPSLCEMAVFVLSSAVAGPFDGTEVGRLVIASEPNEAAMMAMIGPAAERRAR